MLLNMTELLETSVTHRAFVWLGTTVNALMLLQIKVG